MGMAGDVGMEVNEKEKDRPSSEGEEESDGHAPLPVKQLKEARPSLPSVGKGNKGTEKDEDEDAKDCGALTLENTDSNRFEGRVTGRRPRKRENSSHRMMACMVWSVHRGVCEKDRRVPC